MTHFTLSSGVRVPAIGLGTFGSDKYSPAQVGNAVQGAIEAGYRHIDCAAVYGNEREVGAAIRRSGVAREDLWITSKLWNDSHGRVLEACERSLRDLGIDSLDLYLVHWPFPNHHAPGVDVDARDAHARPYDHDAYMRTWRDMEELVRRGWVRHIGTSNMTVSKLSGVLSDASIRPEANQMELHPHFQQPELFEFVRAAGMLPIAYSPLGSPSRPERDRTGSDTVDMEDPVIVGIAEELNLTPAAVCIKWAVTRGQLPIPFSIKPEQYRASLQAAQSAPLSPAHMAAIAGIDKRCRLIKGQVFLWEGAAGWEDLWA